MRPAGAGAFLSSSEIYDPVSDVWSPTGALPVAWTKLGHNTASLLTAPGQLLIAGGTTSNSGAGIPTSEAALYTVSSHSWAFTASMGSSRDVFQQVVLNDGLVLTAFGASGGGRHGSQSLASFESFDGGGWVNGGRDSLGRQDHALVLLNSGQALVVGGFTGATGITATAEIYSNGGWSGTGFMSVARWAFGNAVVLGDGSVLVCGGATNTNNAHFTVTATTEVYTP